MQTHKEQQGYREEFTDTRLDVFHQVEVIRSYGFSLTVLLIGTLKDKPVSHLEWEEFFSPKVRRQSRKDCFPLAVRSECF